MHTIIYDMCICYGQKENTFSPLQVKNKPSDGETKVNSWLKGLYGCEQ